MLRQLSLLVLLVGCCHSKMTSQNWLHHLPWKTRDNLLSLNQHLNVKQLTGVPVPIYRPDLGEVIAYWLIRYNHDNYAIISAGDHTDRAVKHSFTASIAESNVPEIENGVIIFSHIVSGIFDDYNPRSGIFTASSKGDYIFLVSVDVNANYTQLAIRLNGEPVVYGENDGDHHITTWTTLSLVVGDTVTVTHAGEVGGTIDGGKESILTGILL